jgi:hypothetical protein
MDNCSSHITSHVITLLTEGQVRFTTFASLPTQTFQLFDVTFFGVLKWHRRCELPFEDGKVAAEFLMKVYHGLKQGMMESKTR